MSKDENSNKEIEICAQILPETHIYALSKQSTNLSNSEDK